MENKPLINKPQEDISEKLST